MVRRGRIAADRVAIFPASREKTPPVSENRYLDVDNPRHISDLVTMCGRRPAAEFCAVSGSPNELAAEFCGQPDSCITHMD
jgi:hypothetical protein